VKVRLKENNLSESWKWKYCFSRPSSLLLFAYARDSICACPIMKRTCFSSRGVYSRILLGGGSAGMVMFDEKNARGHFEFSEESACYMSPPPGEPMTWRV
jgi:hypothetical protein